MKKHLEKNWGWYGIAIFQLILIGLKLCGFFPYVTWFGILLPAEIIGGMLILFYIHIRFWHVQHKSPKE